ncbi:MAG: sodium:proton antiporter, partial [Synechococcus sp.]
MSTLLGTYLLVIGFLLITSVYLDRVGNRLQLPGVLLVLLLGLLTHNEVHVGSQTPPLLSLTQASGLAQVAVAVVLFQAGISTNWQQMRSVARPGLRLALLGSTLTALLLMLVLQKLPIEFLSVSHASWALPLVVGEM